MVLHLAVPVLVLVTWGGWLFLPALLASVVSFRWALRQHLNPSSPQFVRRLQMDEEGYWLLDRRSGTSRARLSGTSLLMPGLCVMVFCTGPLRRCAVLVDDSAVSRESFRRLRIVLKRESRKIRSPT